jgi:hypothetical protein
MTATGYGGSCVVENLSASGALLVGQTKLGVGGKVGLLLQLEDCARRFALEARVVRHAMRREQPVFAVEFVNVPAVTRAAVRALVARNLAAAPPARTILVIDLPGDVARPLGDDLAALGRDACTLMRPWDSASLRRAIEGG